MSMFNVTEVRQNVSKIIAEAIETKEPIILLQRSKPVAYIIEAKTFEKIQSMAQQVEYYKKNEMAKETLKKMAELRSEMKPQPDSTPLIRRLREGEERYE